MLNITPMTLAQSRFRGTVFYLLFGRVFPQSAVAGQCSKPKNMYRCEHSLISPDVHVPSLLPDLTCFHFCFIASLEQAFRFLIGAGTACVCSSSSSTAIAW